MNTELRTLTESEIDFVAGGALSGALGVGVGVGSAKTHTSTFTKASSGFFGSSAEIRRHRRPWAAAAGRRRRRRRRRRRAFVAWGALPASQALVNARVST